MSGWASALLALTVAAPLLALPFIGRAGRYGWLLHTVPAAPALVAALVVPDGTELALPWLLAGGGLVLDGVGRAFLLLAAVLWPAAGLFAGPGPDHHRARFQGAWLVLMAANFLLTTTRDPVLFLLAFAAVGLVGYLLVVHEGTPEARRAANVYVALAALGEALLFAGLVAFAAYGAILPGWAVAALVAGFGIKSGLVPLHLWMPGAYRAASHSAGAVVAGSLINAGLLGWLRFLPLGEVGYAAWGEALVVAGLAGAFGGVIVGLGQRRPRTVLAYSSISQMGWLVVAVGLGLMAPAGWPALEGAVVVFAVHHGLTKGTLFLAAGGAQRVAGGVGQGLAAVGLLLPAAALMGLPGTTGGAAKDALKHAGSGMAALSLGEWLTWGSVATTVLVVRFLFLAWPRGGAGLMPISALGWAGAVVAGPLLLGMWGPLSGAGEALWRSGHAWGAAWPVLTAAGAAALAGWLFPGGLRRMPVLPAGDLLVLLEVGAGRLAGHWQGVESTVARWWIPTNRLWGGLKRWLWDPWRYRVFAADRWGWLGSGTAFLGVAVGLLVLLTWR